MKRDMDLIRAILLRVEEEYGGISITNLSIEGNSLEEVAVHCKMLEDAGLVTSCGINEMSFSTSAKITRASRSR